jgi:hypothetical protein
MDAQRRGKGKEVQRGIWEEGDDGVSCTVVKGSENRKREGGAEEVKRGKGGARGAEEKRTYSRWRGDGSGGGVE